MKKRTVILGACASVALYKSCDVVRKLLAEDLDVNVVMTRESEQLISPVLFQSLSGNKVYSGDLFREPGTWEIEHVSLAQKADLVLIAPATANIIGKLACGICDDLLTCIVCATKAPVLICPAMNTGMYRNKIVQGNIRKLQSLGYKFVGPVEGKLACGDKGIGCLAGVEQIVHEVKKCL